MYLFLLEIGPGRRTGLSAGHPLVSTEGRARRPRQRRGRRVTIRRTFEENPPMSSNATSPVRAATRRARVASLAALACLLTGAPIAAQPAGPAAAQPAGPAGPAAARSASPAAAHPAGPAARSVASPATQAPAFTLEQVLAYAFPSSLVMAPGGDRIAWLANDRGHRNVWVADAPRWEPRKLTPYDSDDGRDLSALQFLPDGQRLIYLRGHGTNMSGEVANPTSDIEGASRDLWLVDVRGGTPRRIAGAVNAIVAPTGARIAWVDGRDAMLLDLDTRPAANGRASAAVPEPTRIFTVRSSLGELRWSPDGTRIAFSSPRDGRAILGVFDVASRTLSWLTNSADRDGAPRWSADGRTIAFVRHQAGIPGYSVWLVDAAGAAPARALWQSPQAPTAQGGSIAYPRAIAGSYDLMFGDGHVVVPGEWDGWNRLYAIPLSGGEARALTRGDGIVETAVLSHDREWVWLSTNTQAIDYRQLGRIRLGDGHTEWLENGEVIAWDPAPSRDGRSIAYLRADATEHAGVYRRELGTPASVRVSRIDPSFPQNRLVRPEQVVYGTQDGWDIHGQLFLPPAAAPGTRHPAIVFMHGGSRRQMLLGWHNRDYYHNAYAFNQYLASRGYVVLSINYRSGIGYGTAFRNAPNYGRGGASEYQDVLDAGLWLQQHERVDPARIGLWGGSYGGYLTALGLARNSDIFRAGVDLHGVHDWNESARWYGRRELPAGLASMNAEARETAFRSSPVSSIMTWTSPVLIIHGDDDRNVAFEASIDLVRRLRQKGDVHFEELYFIDDVHGFLRFANWLETFRTSADFFDRMLKGQ
jgi:dipeptidyl aminopeptidase/acylaminoacyl peptidase